VSFFCVGSGIVTHLKNHLRIVSHVIFGLELSVGGSRAVFSEEVFLG